MMSRFTVCSHSAEGINRLQSDLNPVPKSYIGFLFPTFLQLQHIYEQLSNSNGLKFCMPLASAFLADINMRFSHYPMFSDSTQTQSAALAPTTPPAFKQCLERMRTLFLNTSRFLSAREHQQEAIKSGRFIK